MSFFVVFGSLFSYVFAVGATKDLSDHISFCNIFNMTHNFSKTMEFGTSHKLHIYCYRGESLKLHKLYQQPQVTISHTNTNYHLYFGHNASHVYDEYTRDILPAGWDMYRKLKGDKFKLNPFTASCVGVWAQSGAYTVTFIVKAIDIWLVLYQLTGIILFFSAKHLSKNAAFHYSAGVGLGLIASLVIIAFILARFIPKKAGVAAVLLGSCSLTLYAVSYVLYSLDSLLRDHYQVAAAYVIVVSLVSFAACYAYGPVTADRSLSLIRWSIQLGACALCYAGSQIPEVAVALVTVLLVVHNMPSVIVDKFRKSWFKYRLPKRKWLTEEEYQREGDEMTRKALDDLRQYCRSAGCDAWSIVSRLHDPARFANFVSGQIHVTDAELLDYDTYQEIPATHTDSSESDESDGQLVNHRALSLTRDVERR